MKKLKIPNKISYFGYLGIRIFYTNLYGMWEACSYQNINIKDGVRIDITSLPEIKEILNLQVS